MTRFEVDVPPIFVQECGVKNFTRRIALAGVLACLCLPVPQACALTVDNTAHGDSRAGQQFEVFVDDISPGEDWVSLGSFASASPGGSQQSHHMQLASYGSPGIKPFASGVSAIRFALRGTCDYGDVWREIDVQGEPTSLPSGVILIVR